LRLAFARTIDELLEEFAPGLWMRVWRLLRMVAFWILDACLHLARPEK
jgi:hypothetical protein